MAAQVGPTLRNNPLPDDWLIELGRLTSLWAALDNGLNTYLGIVSGFQVNDERWFILLAHASFPQRVNALEAMCGLLASQYPRLAECRTAISALKAAQTARNHYVHNVISFDPDRRVFVLAKGTARGQLRTSVTDVQLADIKAASMSVRNALQELHTLIAAPRPTAG